MLGPVALSRARHGLYILGNASDLSSQSPMWETVIGELREQGCLDKELPIICHRHPEELRYVSKPGDLPRLSPDGKIPGFLKKTLCVLLSLRWMPTGM